VCSEFVYAMEWHKIHIRFDQMNKPRRAGLE
jgi:hypothetical protein